MNATSCRLAVETLEGRELPSTVAYGDFNNDGRLDMAAITAPTKVTVSLANPDGSYTASAILTVPKSQSLTYIGVYDYNGDGNDDIYASSPSGYGQGNYSKWLGNGDGTFGEPTSGKLHLSPGRWHWWV